MNEATKKLDWFGAISRNGHHGGRDVTINHTISEDGKRHLASFTFRNDCWKLFTETPYMEIALYKNRVFFRQSDEKHGITLLRNKQVTESTRYARMQNGFADRFITFEGDYELKYDEFYELYYVEREENKE